MVNLISSFKSLKKIKVGVIGDLVVDSYVIGTITRISPEAPVPVLHAKEMKHIPGMAGNVALNLISLGAEVYLIGRTGEDRGGLDLMDYLNKEKIDTEGVIQQALYPTAIKQRVIASSQQLLRIDHEEVTPLSIEAEMAVTAYLKKIVDQLDVIAISDYKKGFLTHSLLKQILDIARERNIPVIVDPKGDDFSKYKGCTLIKPNLSEAYHAASHTKQTSLDQIGSILLEKVSSKYLLVTRSEEGMTLFSKEGGRKDFPVKSQEVKDVTGAGDTVLAVMAYGFGNKLSVEESIELANTAASIAIQKIGCSRVTLSEILDKLLQINPKYKVFDSDHLFALNQALEGKDFLLFTIDEDQQMSLELFEAIRALSKIKEEKKLLVYLKSSEKTEPLTNFLASLNEVNFVVKSVDHLSKLLQKLLPSKTFYLKNNSVLEVEKPSELLEKLLFQKIN